MNLSFSKMIVYPNTAYSTSQIQGNITKIYRDILKRDPSPTELSQWLNAIRANVYAYRDLQDTIYASNEYIQNQALVGATVTPSAEPVVVVKEKPKAGVFLLVSTGVLWLLSHV